MSKSLPPIWPEPGHYLFKVPAFAVHCIKDTEWPPRFPKKLRLLAGHWYAATGVVMKVEGEGDGASMRVYGFILSHPLHPRGGCYAAARFTLIEASLHPDTLGLMKNCLSDYIQTPQK